MLPVALGTHARGSTIRPASFCAAYALKPTFGAINRQGSFSMAYSMDHIGVFAGTLSDMWTTARYMASEAGGDPSHPGLYGALEPPAPRKPARLIRLDTAGWPNADPQAMQAFEQCLERLADTGVDIVGRGDDPSIEAYEVAHARTPQLWSALYRYEMHWPMLQYRERYGDKLPPRLLKASRTGRISRRKPTVPRLSSASAFGPCTPNWRGGPMASSLFRRPVPPRSGWIRAAQFSMKRPPSWARRPSTCRC
jgi:Asp-tRNA(Asn)/Glu-tRNA(Gln) amidotransferase A subunit family amidase